MNKNELISAMSNSTSLNQTQSAEALQSFIDTVVSQLRSGSEVKVIGFGTFKISKRKATTGRNPRTGEPIDIPASNQPKFSAGKALKQGVN